MIISVKHKGNFKKTEKYLKKIGEGNFYKGLSLFGEIGVKALNNATPKDTGKTAASWTYSIEKSKERILISWNNTNIIDGSNVAILIQKGHGTSSGYYVRGIDYINPTLKPIFDEIGRNIWKEVTSDA